MKTKGINIPEDLLDNKTKQSYLAVANSLLDLLNKLEDIVAKNPGNRLASHELRQVKAMTKRFNRMVLGQFM